MATIKHYKEDALISGEFTLHEDVESVGQWLLDNIEPGSAFAVYCGQPCKENAIELTPEVLACLPDGDYSIFNTPAGIATSLIILSLVIGVAVIALIPKPDLPQNVNRQQESPNNQLSSRSNRARPLQRVPDIKGQVLSISDVIMPTYSVYRGGDGIEIEHSTYCVGRKSYLLEEFRDGDTPVSTIDGAGVAVYPPFSMPNSESPSQTIGSEIAEKIVTPYRINQINGIDLPADFATGILPSDEVLAGNDFVPGNDGKLQLGGDINLTVYQVGDTVSLVNFIVDGVDISGTHTILVVFSSVSNFLVLDDETVVTTDFGDPGGTMSPGGAKEFTSWAYFTRRKADRLIINVVASGGMYKDDGSVNLATASVDYKLEVQEVDDTNSPIGAATTLEDSIAGDSQSKVGSTTRHEFASPRKFRVRGARVTPRDTAFAGTVVDGIKWDDCYAIVDLDDSHTFGDVTIFQSQTIATPFATAVKDRQQNCLATELLNVYEGGGVFNGSLTPNVNAIQSFIKDSIDPVIGNRSLAEIDADGLLVIDAEISDYFGTLDNNQFSYTYDSTEISYQDYGQQLFNAINCIGYRDGSIIKARFERPITAPAMLFTHRSKIPGTERHSRNFNESRIHDGIEFNWVDPELNTTETIFLPSDKTAVNPFQLNIPGIRNRNQATIRSEREFNKVRLNKINLDVTVTAEGRFVLPHDVIAVVKGARVYTEDGDVLAQNGLVLTLSQDVVFVMGDVHSVTLKDDDGTTENIIVSAGVNANQVVLGIAPVMTIRTGIESRRTEFSFGNDARNKAQLWLAQEIDISDRMQVALKAINYDVNYYAGDGVNLSAYSDGFSDGFG